MAAFGTLLAEWGPTIVKNLPHIIAGGVELYNVFCNARSSNNEKKAVDDAMELIKEHQGDIDRLMEDRKQTMAMLQGLSVMMERLTQHYGSPGVHHIHSPHNESSDDEDYGAASSEPPSSWRVCAVCYNNYNMSRRKPTILMCGHTFCRKCLGEIAVRGPLRCPTCNAYESRPAAALPTNVVLMVALEEESPSRGSGAENTRSDGEEVAWKKNCALLLEEEELQMQTALQRSMMGSGAENTRNDREEDNWKKTSTFLEEDEELQMQTALQNSMSEADNWKKTSTFLQEEEESQMQTALQLSMRQSGAEGDRDNDHGEKSSDLLQEDMLVQLAVQLSLQSE